MGISGTIDNRASVSVVDDDEDTRLLLRDMVESSQHFRFAGGFASAREALRGVPRLQSQLALVGVQLNDLSGIECTRRLKRVMPALKTIIFAGAHDLNLPTASFKAGAVAYLVKPIGENQLLATLSFAVATARQDSVNKIGPRPSNPAKPRPNLPLSPREMEVLSALAEGLLYKEISEKLGISYAAVHKHQHNIFTKLKVSNRSEAIRTWFECKRR